MLLARDLSGGGEYRKFPPNFRGSGASTREEGHPAKTPVFNPPARKTSATQASEIEIAFLAEIFDSQVL